MISLFFLFKWGDGTPFVKLCCIIPVVQCNERFDRGVGHNVYSGQEVEARPQTGCRQMVTEGWKHQELGADCGTYVSVISSFNGTV